MKQTDTYDAQYMGACAGMVVVALIVGFMCAWLVIPSHKGALSCSEWVKVGESVRHASSSWWTTETNTSGSIQRTENGELVEAFSQTCTKRTPIHIQEDTHETK